MAHQQNWSKHLLGLLVGFYASAPVLAAPGTIADTPLIVTQTAQPNIMLMLDSSGSMAAFVPQTPYDENVKYGNCPSSRYMSTAGSIWVLVKSDGRAYFEHVNGGYTSYDWGTTSGNGHTGNPNRCFDPNATYQADLSADYRDTSNSFGYGASTQIVYSAGGRGNTWGGISGNFLNWYFSDNGTAGENFGAGAYEKPGMSTRMDVAADAAEAMVDSLSNVNIGLTVFNGSSGGTLLQHVQDIGLSGYKTDLKSSISGISPGGSTPLAETMEEIGRYFIEGFESQSLTKHPNGTPSTIDGDDLFSHELYDGTGTDPSGRRYTGSNWPSSSDPIMETDKYCQKNFIVGLTDGLPSNDGSVDSDLSGYASDGDSYDLNDVALALYEMDLRPDIDDLDGSEYQNNIISYMIGFADEALQQDTLLQTTAANGGGSNYVADDAAQLAAAFNAISADIGAKTGSVASVAFNSSTLSSDSAVFQARFDTTKWSGNLLSLPLDANGNLPPDNDGDGFPDPDWDAADKLDAFSASALANRVILTHDGSDGAVFSYSSNTAAPTAAHASDLAFDSTTNSADNEVQARLNYIRGDRSNEGASGNGYRTRNSILGDIVNSTPVYVGASEISWPNSFGAAGNRHYLNYVQATSTDTEDGISDRTPVIYVGANDGMLHGFNATTGQTDSGKEVFAYIPRKVLSSSRSQGLHYFVDDSYVHKFYVDLTPTVSDVYIKNTTSGTKDWRTVLVGGLRAGGAGYFALDVTNPANFANTAAAAEKTVLWEFTDSDDADLGYTFARPVIAKMNNGKWAAIFGNGYNSANGEAKLFIAYIEEGLDGWSTGDYIEIGTGVGTSGNKNGLSSATAADMNKDGLVDRIYAGDLKGNMWAFDVSNASDSAWGVAYSDGSSNPEPLFVAKDSSGTVQPITSAPLLALNTSNVPSGTAPNLLVLFGTGQYVTNADVSSLDQQSFYAVWDNDDLSTTNTALERSDLVVRNFSSSSVSGVTGLRRQVTGSAINWNNDHGWYVDLLAGVSGGDAAERVVSEPLIRRKVLFFNTIVPDSRPCSDGGTGWLVSVDFTTGLAPSDAVFDANNDGVIDSADAAYVGQEILDGLPAQSGILGDVQFTPTSDGQLAKRDIEVGSSFSEGRLGWQELTPQK